MYWWRTFEHDFIVHEKPPDKSGDFEFITTWGALPLCNDEPDLS